MSFTVPRSEFEGEMRQQLRAAGRKVRMKGFRPGKVPPRVLERHFGGEARQRALEVFFNRAFEQAVREETLDTVGHQRVALEDIQIPEDADFSHSFEVSLRPALELVEYKGLRIESELEPVLEQEVQAALDDLRRQRSRPEPAGEAGLAEGGMALCRLAWVKDGETVLERDGLRLSPQDQLPGVEPEAWRQAVLGKKKGDVVELSMTIPPDFERADLRGAAATTRLELQEAFRMIPPSDEEVQELLGVKGPEELLSTCRDRIRQAKESREQMRVESALLERVLSEQEMELPARMVEAQVQTRRNALKLELEAQNQAIGQGQAAGQALSPEDVERELARQEEEIRTAVTRGVKAYFLVQGIARAESLQVESQDLVAELKDIAARNQATYEEVRDYYREKGLIEQVAIELLERKVRALLREHAEIAQPA